LAREYGDALARELREPVPAGAPDVGSSWRSRLAAFMRLGRRRRNTPMWDDPPDAGLGGAPVREPRRPRPTPLSGAMALPLPRDDD
jgi:hypothetical protein